LPCPALRAYLARTRIPVTPTEAPLHLGFHLTVNGLSDIGRVRNRNEDCLALVPELGAAVIADGMGGHPGGHVASRIAAETAAAHLGTLLPIEHPVEPDAVSAHLSQAMAEAVMWAHGAVRSEGSRDPVLDGMGTTLTAIAIDTPTGVFAIGHVGDSRVYRLRGGTLRQLTRDDTWVQQRVDASELTVDQAKRHPFGHMLTQCVGLPESPSPQILTGHVEPDDAYLLCTDGLTGMLDDDRLCAILSDAAADMGEGDRSGRALRALIEQANEAGGYDNITAALIFAS
jgi:serine/threonine protein phosphatase PrpC